MDHIKINKNLENIVKLADAKFLVALIVDSEGEVQIVSRPNLSKLCDVSFPDMKKMSDEFANLVNVLRAAKFIGSETPIE